MRSTKRILLVEDNADDELLTLRALRRNGIDCVVEVARDGAEALETLLRAAPSGQRDWLGQPDLVLLDISLPKVSGLEVLRQLRRHTPTSLLPIVMLTSSREEEDVLRSYALGANSYVRKPVDFSEFVAAVRQLGTYWLALNEAPPPRPAR